jgi:hypothetical protein
MADEKERHFRALPRRNRAEEPEKRRIGGIKTGRRAGNSVRMELALARTE